MSDGVVAPCVALLIKGCWAAAEDVPHCIQGRVRHRGQEGSHWIFHLHRLTGDGRQSIPAPIRKDIWPAGRLNIIRDHTCVCCSNWTTSRSFVWTDNDSRCEFHSSQWILTRAVLTVFKTHWALGGRNSTMRLIRMVLTVNVVLIGRTHKHGK